MSFKEKIWNPLCVSAQHCWCKMSNRMIQFWIRFWIVKWNVPAGGYLSPLAIRILTCHRHSRFSYSLGIHLLLLFYLINSPLPLMSLNLRWNSHRMFVLVSLLSTSRSHELVWKCNVYTKCFAVNVLISKRSAMICWNCKGNLLSDFVNSRRLCSMHWMNRRVKYLTMTLWLQHSKNWKMRHRKCNASPPKRIKSWKRYSFLRLPVIAKN